MGPTLTGLAIGFVVLGVVLWPLERLFPALPQQPLARKGFTTDLAYAIVLHANVTWSFGPLRYVLASPTFHRWHHTSEEEVLDRNFAGLFPVFDLVFGTFYMPPGRGPQRFGLAREAVPDGLLAQLAYPFRAEPRGREGQAAS